MTKQIELNTVAINSAAATFAKAEHKGAEELAKVLGTKPTFAHWEAVRKVWTVAYSKAREEVAKVAPSLEASDRAWQRVAKAMSEFFALEKPKAPSKAATKKSDQRKAADKARADLAKQYPDTATALKAAQGCEEPAQARKLWELVATYKKADAQAAKKAENATTKATRDQVRKLANDSDAKTLIRLVAFAGFYRDATTQEVARFDALLAEQSARLAAEKPKGGKRKAA